MNPLTKKQLRVLRMVKRLTFPMGPTCKALGNALGLSPRGAHEHLRALSRKGLVELAGQGKARGLNLTPKGKALLRD